MGRLLENQSLSILEQNGLPVPRHQVAASPREAWACAEELGMPVVVKALIPVGKRGKAGAVKFAGTPAEAAEAARSLLGTTVRHFPVEKVLVEERLDTDHELFVTITIDKGIHRPVVLLSSAGGMDIEEIAKKYPDRLRRIEVNPYRNLPEFKCKEAWAEQGLAGGVLRAATGVLHKLYHVFTKYDATILEINPLIVTRAGEVKIAAAVMAVDDAAMFRHPELKDYVQLGSERSWRPLTELEKQIVLVNEADPYRGTARYTEIDGGDIGFMCGGGGGSLMTFDALLSYGGKPANYTEFGGNPPESKVYGLAKGILSKPGVKGFLLCANISNNTQVDVVARGVTRALRDAGIDTSRFPVLIRFAGVHGEEGRRIFEEAGVEYYGEEITMSMAAERMVKKMEAFFGKREERSV